MKPARQTAEEIMSIFFKHWALFRKDLDAASLECRDKRLAWKMAILGITKFVYKQAPEGVIDD